MMPIKFLLILIITIVKLIVLAEAATISCTYNGVSPQYACLAQTNDEITTENQPISVDGVHNIGANNSDVNILSFNGGINVLIFIPTNIFSTFQHLTSILIQASHVTKMTSNAFINCDALNSIEVKNNAFPNLAASFAESCTKLETLIMSNNGIKTVDIDAFKGLSNLKLLNMNGNKIVYIEPSTFQNAPNLSNIYLNDNAINEISPDTFKGLTNLIEIFLDRNKVAVLHMLNLADSPRLSTFSINSNLIEAIDPLFSSDYPGTRTYNWGLFLKSNVCVDTFFVTTAVIGENDLQECYANYKRIMGTTTVGTTTIEVPTTIVATTTIEVPTTTVATTTIEVPTTTTVALNSGTCGTRTHCRYFLDQHKNYACVLEDIQYSITEINGDHAFEMTDDDVTYLYFINSKLSIIPRVIFDTFRKLKFLSVESTHLNIINNDTLEVCGSELKKLDASHNQIYRIDKTSLTKCSKLEWLDLTGNPIKGLNDLFHSDSKLIQIVMNHEI